MTEPAASKVFAAHLSASEPLVSQSPASVSEATSPFAAANVTCPSAILWLIQTPRHMLAGRRESVLSARPVVVAIPAVLIVDLLVVPVALRVHVIDDVILVNGLVYVHH